MPEPRERDKQTASSSKQLRPSVGRERTAAMAGWGVGDDDGNPQEKTGKKKASIAKEATSNWR